MKSAFISFVVTSIVLLAFVGSINAQGPRQRQALPPTGRIQQIQSDFLQLSRPLDFTLQTEDDWSGIDGIQRSLGARPDKATRIKLHGDAKEFQDKYSAGEVALALYPFFRDDNNDAEACIMMFAVQRTDVRPKDIATTFRSREQPGDWQSQKASVIRYAKGDALEHVLQNFTGWNPKAPQYKVPPDQILPSSLKKNEENSLVSSATSVATTTPQATPLQMPTPQGVGTVEPPKPTPTATAAKPETKPKPTPAAQNESQKQTWPLWLGAVAVVLGVLGILAYRSRKQ